MSNSSEKEHKQLTIALIISMVFWGLSWPSAKVLTQFGHSPIELGIVRYAFVVVSLLILLWILKIPVIISKKAIPYLILSGVLMAIYNFTFLKGVEMGSPGAGGILVTTMNPLMAYGLGMLIDWRRPNKNEFIGLGLGILAGCTLLQIWDTKINLLEAGNSFFLLSALLWAIMSRFTSKSAKYGSAFSYTWWLYFVTFLCLIPVMNGMEVKRLVAITDLTFWGNILFGSVIVTTLATTLYFYATSKVGAEKASSFIFTVPLMAALSSWFILGEAIQIHTVIGGVLGITAVYMINRKIKR